MAATTDLSAFEKRKAEFKARAEVKRAERAALEDQAEKDGQLWTVQIAYKPDEAVALISYGRVADNAAELFRLAHPEAHMYMDPQVILGDKLHVRQQACKLANTDNFRIFVYGAPKEPRPNVPNVFWS